jgi:NAD(P) transhydrogenase subunit beta
LSQDIAALLYLVASVCFIMALQGLSSPQTSRAAISASAAW